MLGNKTKICTICKARGYTEWHHIISQHHAIVSGQEELIENPDNVIELCKRCHDQTTASMVRKRLQKEGKKTPKRRPRPKKLRQPKREVVAESKEDRMKAQKEIMEASISSLQSRGVFHDSPPPMHLREFLNITRYEDETNDKWYEIISKNDFLFPNSLFPPDHWMHNENAYDKKRSAEFEEDGFCWCSNGQPWKGGVSQRRARFEIDIANVRSEERAALEELQKVALSEEEVRKKLEEKEGSWKQLESRGVLYLASKSPPLGLLQGRKRRHLGFLAYLKKISFYDQTAAKWVERLENDTKNPFDHLYPEDHWLHDTEKFNKKNSSEFEEDGFCWTQDGGIWKNNLTLRQIESEIRLADIRIKAAHLVSTEEAHLERERAVHESEQRKQKSISSLAKRGSMVDPSPRLNHSILAKYLHGISSESETAERWSQYFKEVAGPNPLLRLYPEDHWEHSEEDFHHELSQAFEEDGFGWTRDGLAWIEGLSLEQVDAEVRLAKIKRKQAEILENEKAILEKIKSKKSQE